MSPNLRIALFFALFVASVLIGLQMAGRTALPPPPAPQPQSPPDGPPPTAPPAPDASSKDPSDEDPGAWQVAPGFGLGEQAQGVSGPVAIAFLNRPTDEPDAPLFLVTELRGAIKVVRRNGVVETFGEIPNKFLATKPLPTAPGSYGLHGICFDGNDEHLYTTSVVPFDGRPRNRITRWKSVGAVPWTRGEVVDELRAPFEDVGVALGHSIGNCLVASDGKLWVGTGDNAFPDKSHDPKVSVGKILRMDLDFSAARDNPFFDSRRPKAIESYVYAMGLRNPWAIAEGEDGRMYVADNGPVVDRLVLIERGHDFPWNGSDSSFLYDNLMVWTRPLGPASMVFVNDSPALPGIGRSLLIAAAGGTGLVIVPLDPHGRPAAPASYLFKRPKPAYDVEALSGLAKGPDGLYVAHMRFDERQFFRPSAILKLDNGPNADAASGDEHEGQAADPADLLATGACLGCHSHQGRGTPRFATLDGLRARLSSKLADPAYRKRLEAAAADTPVITALLAAPPSDQPRLWVEAKLRNPRFEDPNAEMPPPPLDEASIVALAKFLVADT